MATGTVRLHRIIRAPAEVVYRAYLDPAAMAKWLPPFGFTCTVEHMDARVGGTFRMAFHNFRTGNGHSFGGTYLALEAPHTIRYNDTFDDPNLPGTMVTSVKLTPVICGTEVEIVQEGIPEAIPTAFCYLGWQESLVQLAQLVEPNLPD